MKILAKFHENIPNLSQEIEKNTENVPPPPKKLNSKSPHPTQSLLYYSHQSIIKNTCAKFHKKPKGSDEIDKKIPQN